MKAALHQYTSLCSTAKKLVAKGMVCLLVATLGGTDIVAQTPQNQTVGTTTDTPTSYLLRGTVTDEQGEPVPGAIVRVVRMKPSHKLLMQTVTNEKGVFQCTTHETGLYITVNCLGYVGYTTHAKTDAPMHIVLKEQANTLNETVITGYFQKAKNSFTGTAVQVSGDDLRKVSTQNLLAGLKVFDPSFQVIDTRGMFGSDPNHLPTQIQMRGTNAMPDISQSNLQTLTSLPVFILDGFEVSLQRVYDLDMNRVQSVTLLKDASAAAIYGSRAANGVVVIETVSPQSGKLQWSYNLNGGVEMPDLSSYQLMNAGEVLAFQQAAGVFDAYKAGEDAGTKLNAYNVVKRAVMSSVDTYWPAKPLQTGLRQRHSLLMEGGVGNGTAQRGQLRFSLNLAVALQNGVMKGSGRKTYEVGNKWIYSTEKLQISNNLQWALTQSNESPYGNFSTYTATLPYYQDKDAQGNYYSTLSIANMAPPALALGVLAWQRSPVYEAKYLNSFSTAQTANLSNQLSVNWEILPGLRIKGGAALTYGQNHSDVFVSPRSFAYALQNSTNTTVDNLQQRGRYNLSKGTSSAYDLNIVASYIHTYGRLDLQTVLGGELRQTRSQTNGYALTGFLGDAQHAPAYALQYEYGARPQGNETLVRTAGAFCNMNFSWNNRYLADITGRIDGSSLYGKNQKTAAYWSAGLRWNLHNEHFLRRFKLMDRWVLRTNIGTTGNQNYTRNQAANVYGYINTVYGGFFGATVTALGNPNLHGQRTLNRNMGMEMSWWNQRVNLEVNLYYNTTMGNLTSITTAPSLGFTSYKANMGDLTNRGIDFNLSITALKTRNALINITWNGARNSNRIEKISDALKHYNDLVNEQIGTADATAVPTVFLFQEGQSMNTIYAVRSLGIDPGTGYELYLDRYGNTTMTWQAADQVPVGVNEPTLQGYTGLNLRYKAWELNAQWQYSFGAQKYNYTLHSKIENVNYLVNNDRRALQERWKQPGDVARYKSIRDNSATRATSRFVQTEQLLSLSSLRIAYTLQPAKNRNTWFSLLRFALTGNDLFYASTIRQERGLAYPFARAATFSLQLNF